MRILLVNKRVDWDCPPSNVEA